MSIDFRTAVLAMSAERPHAHVSTIVALALAVENALPPDLGDAPALARWAWRQPHVARLVRAGETVQAIKELRAAADAGLKQAKDAVDLMRNGQVQP